ncbi:MAG: cupin, partial [Myxococcota bacterium]
LTGKDCMKVLGFSAMMLRPQESASLPKRSASGVLKVVSGSGNVTIAEEDFRWEDNDVMSIPTFTSVEIENTSAKHNAYLFLIDDAPLHKNIGCYQLC